MNSKRSPFVIQEKKTRDFDNAEYYPTLADLIKEQNSSENNVNTVHRRRDLDSLG